MIFKDDLYNPGRAVTEAQQLISARVDVILDASQLSSTWAKAAADAGIPVVGGNIISDLYFTKPDFYPSGETSNSTITADVLTAKQAGAKTMGQLYCAETPVCQQGVEPHKKAGKNAGVPFVYTASISGTAPNYTAQCLAAKEAGVQALFVGEGSETFARVASDCHLQGYDPIYIEEGIGFNMQLAQTPALNNHLYADFPILPFFADRPAVQKMNTTLDKYAPGIRDNADTYGEFSTLAWSGALLIEKAVENADSNPQNPISASDVRKGLDSMKNETLGGFSPPLTFEAGKAHNVNCWYTGKIENGKPTLANSGRLTCASG